MRRLLAGLCALLAAIGVGGCDEYALRSLKPGVSTAADVRRVLGDPTEEWRNHDGSMTLSFTRQPQGITCYMAVIGQDGRLRSVEQVLDDAHFAQVASGMDAERVRHLLGRPAKETRFALKRESVWYWLIENQNGAEPVYFTVTFDTSGRVTGSGRFTEYRGG